MRREREASKVGEYCVQDIILCACVLQSFMLLNNLASLILIHWFDYAIYSLILTPLIFILV